MNQLVYLGVGANIGDRESNLFTAIAALDVRDDISVNRTASIYESDPMYNQDQPNFLNSVVEIETSLQPEIMMQVCLTIIHEFNVTRRDCFKLSTWVAGLMFSDPDWNGTRCQTDLDVTTDRLVKIILFS